MMMQTVELLFDTSLSDLVLHLRSQGCEKAKSSVAFVSESSHMIG